MQAFSSQTSANDSGDTRWYVLLTVIPLLIFCLSRLFEHQIVSFIIPLFPQEPDKGYFFYRDFVQLCFVEFLWISFFLMLTRLALMLVSRNDLRKTRTALVRRPWFSLGLLCGAFLLLTVLTGYFALEQFPNSSDEYAYLYQAETLSKGKLWDRAHDLPKFFHYNHIIQKDGVRISRFPPGWPLFLSTAYWLGFSPALVNPILALVTLLLFYVFVKKYYGELTALLSIAATAFTGYFIFNAASFFSHISCLLAILLFVFNFYLYRDHKKSYYAILAGFFLGLVVITRYYTAVLIFVPFVIYLIHQYRMRSIRILFLIAVGSLPCLLFLFWYNFKITGNPLVPVTMWAYTDEKLGFVKEHTFLKGMEHLVRRVFMFFYWCSPGVLLLYFIFLGKKLQSRATAFTQPEDYFFIALMLGYFFYYQIGGNQYGPRFAFEGLPFMIVMIINQVQQSRPVLFRAVFYASVLFAIIKFPFIAFREHSIINERQDVYDLVEQQKITKAVVLISTSTSTTRPMPVGDLTRNDATFENDVIYAKDHPERNTQLMRYYNDRLFYKYVRDLENPHGKLIRISPDIKVVKR